MIYLKIRNPLLRQGRGATRNYPSTVLQRQKWFRKTKKYSYDSALLSSELMSISIKIPINIGQSNSISFIILLISVSFFFNFAIAIDLVLLSK